MKSLFQYIFIAGIFATGFVACNKDGEMLVAKPGVSGNLTSSTSNVVLEKANASDTVISFQWKEADFGFSAAVTQQMELSVADSNFKSFIEQDLDPKQTQLAFTGQDFNTLVSKLNLPFGTPTQILVRIKSFISDSVAASYSDTLSLTVNPFASISWLYVIGDYNAWDLNTVDSLISKTGNNVYTGIVDFPAIASGYKFIPAKNWNVSYGDNGKGGLTSDNGANFASVGAGSYQLIADLNAKTLDASYFQYSLIGDATSVGWNGDVDMHYNNGDSTWSAVTTLTAGAFKFRKNHDWGTSWGGSNGALVSNGDNISVTTAGTYKIVMDIPNKKYTLTKQ